MNSSTLGNELINIFGNASIGTAVNVNENFLEHFAIYVRSVYVQFQLDFNIKHVC